MEFSSLNLNTEIKVRKYSHNGVELAVSQYLPVHQKVEFIQFIVMNSLDETTGCFSPIRTEIWYGIGLCRWYAGIEFSAEDIQNIEATYDALDMNGIIGCIEELLPEEEIGFMRAVIDETVEDIARYNSSAAGIIGAMSANSSALSEQITELQSKIKNKEGLELLDVIKDVVGND